MLRRDPDAPGAGVRPPRLGRLPGRRARAATRRRSAWRRTSPPSSSPPRAPRRRRSWRCTSTAATGRRRHAGALDVRPRAGRRLVVDLRHRLDRRPLATSSTRRCCAAATTIAYEGALDHPAPDVFYRMLAEHHVTGVFTAPTAVRMLMRHGTDAARRADLSVGRARVLRRRAAQPAGLGVAPAGGVPATACR